MKRYAALVPVPRGAHILMRKMVLTKASLFRFPIKQPDPLKRQDPDPHKKAKSGFALKGKVWSGSGVKVVDADPRLWCLLTCFSCLLPVPFLNWFPPVYLTFISWSHVKFASFFRTSFKHIPKLNGKELDLYLLYWLVTAQGGWEKVRAVRVYKGSGNRCLDPDPGSLLIPNLGQD